MPLSPGTRLGAYEILSPLGAGGMGEVYRGRDSKLGRDVAIKVLPEAVAQDAERLARFEREARALAALNHPGIVTIFSVEESGGTRFLAMELVEGDSLDTLIAPGGLPLPQFFDIAAPLAEALSAAHERGIVHRDLKPGNVMVTREGRVKVLDFGLAKLEGPDSDPNLTSTPTQSGLNLTTEGQVFGTVAYMSPEQARGGKVDARSDVFSLGIVLYQMATGERPFQGASAVDMISSILRDKPPSVTDLRADVPAHLARILRRCLEKDPRDRYQTSRDVYNELRELRSETSSDTSASRPRSEVRSGERPASGPERAEEGFWVAVLPVRYSGASADLTALAEGLTEDIVTGLSRFSYLRVIARSSTAKYASQAVDIRSAGKELGARYVMEGTLRQAGAKLRLAVQVVDTTSGAHLWAENYERAFRPDAVFEVQDDLVPRIVSTVADMHGVLPRSMSEVVRGRAPADLSPYEAVLRSFGYFDRVTAEELAAARSALELAVRKAPGHADAWAMLSLVNAQEYGQGFRLRADAVAEGAIAARRAVEAGPSNHLAHAGLAHVLFLQKEFQAFRNAAARALALNPMDSFTTAIMGILSAYAGDWEHGCALAEAAMRLNPHHPGWYRLPIVVNAYRTRDYRAAIDAALKIQMPGYFWTPVFCAAAFAELDEPEAARKALGELLAIRPEFGSAAREEFGKWHEPELVEHFIDGLRKAGLEIAPDERAAAPALGISGSLSGPIRADEGFWVAVLPFKYGGGDADLTALAAGLSEEIVTGLSRFSYLRVLSRGSTSRYASEAADVRSAGRQLGARYVLDGSLRQAGSVLRVSVQLVDAVSGAHLWAETYTRSFRPDAVFELQDDVVPRVVSTIADWYGVLPHSMSAAVWSKSLDQLSPYEALLRGFGVYERGTVEAHAAARAGLERAVREAPDNADSWAMLSFMYGEEFRFGLNALPDPLGRALQAARRAVDAGPSNHFAYSALAQALYFRKEFDAFRSAAERAVALNPMDGATIEYMAHLIAFSGDWQRGCGLAERGRELNPNYPGWYWAVQFHNAYRNGDYAGARTFLLKSKNVPANVLLGTMLAAVLGQLGEREAAGKAVRELLDLNPDWARVGRDELGKWYLPDHVEQLMDGLRMAGLEISAKGESTAAADERSRPCAPISGASRADEGFWIAVLPFTQGSANADLTALADGLSEEIVAGLSRFSYLRVITSGSTRRYAGEAPDLRQVGKELGARYVMSGSLRQVGGRLRVAVQLVDAATGAQLWAETYERPFSPDAAFELQDDLVSRIVSTVGDPHGILPHTMSESLRSKAPGDLTPYEAVLRSFGFGYRSTTQEHAAIRNALELAVEEEPGYADARAMASLIYTHEYAHGFNLLPDPLGRALQAARRAADLAPSNALAYDALAWALFFRKEFPAFRVAAEQSIALNPLSSPTLAGLGTLIAYSGDWEKGCALVERAVQLNPRHPGWYRFALFADAYRKRDYRGAVNVALRLNLPDFFVTHEVLAAAYGQLGEREEAQKALRELLRLKPDYPATGREKLEKWFDPELVEHWMEGLRKAGLRD